MKGEVPAPEDLIDPFDIGFGLAKNADAGWVNCVNAWVKDGLASGWFRQRYEYWVKQLAEGKI